VKAFYKNKIKILQSLILLIFITLSTLGGDCEKVLVNPPINPVDTLSSYDSLFLGTWNLIYQTGALQDICPNENVIFQSNGIAKLTCPNSSSIERDYIISDSDSTLYYTESNVYYYAQFAEKNQLLTLYGQNVSRNLFYRRVITGNKTLQSLESSGFNNSSQEGRR
jgi:hypothetical protein